MITRKLLLPLLTAAAVVSSATVSHASTVNRLAATPEHPCPSDRLAVPIASGPLQMSSNDAPPTLNIRLMCSNTSGQLTPIAAGQEIKLEILGVWATSEAALNEQDPRNENTSWPYDENTANASYKTFTKASGQYTMPDAGWNKLKNVGKPDTWGVLYWRASACYRTSATEPPQGCTSYGQSKLLFIDHI